MRTFSLPKLGVVFAECWDFGLIGYIKRMDEAGASDSSCDSVSKIAKILATYDAIQRPGDRAVKTIRCQDRLHNSTDKREFCRQHFPVLN